MISNPPLLRPTPMLGVIKGGKLDGWRYLFLGFDIAAGQLQMRCQVSAPNWPFPHDMLMRPAYFSTLRPVPGDRAKRFVPWDRILTAYMAAGKEMPGLFSDPRLSLRRAIGPSRPRRRV